MRPKTTGRRRPATSKLAVRSVRSDEPSVQALTSLAQYRTSDSLLRIALKMAIEPTAEWYYFDLAANHESLKEYREAVANYDTAYYLFRDPTVLYTCGRICETELRDIPRARRYYIRYMAVAQPKTAAEREALAYVRKRCGTHVLHCMLYGETSKKLGIYYIMPVCRVGRGCSAG